jgi:aryl-alcohol dehydrogenase-like predicted oxidoreductase
MQYRNLGTSGLQVSAIGLGTNQFGGKVSETEVKNIISAAIELGVNFLDTANIYQNGRSEETIGKAIKGRREAVLVATKFGHTRSQFGPNESGGSTSHIMHAVEASLKRLDIDYIDLYQMHQWDENTPLEETLRTLDDLVKSGKVRYIGASNYSAGQLARGLEISKDNGWSEFVSIQPHFHMLERGVEKELLPVCQEFGVGVLPYFPLAGGFLTGKYEQGKPAPEGSRGEQNPYVQKYMTDANYAILDRLAGFAKERGQTLTELAHAWLLAQPQVSSIISGATKVAHVQANVKGADWEITKEEVTAIDKLFNTGKD